MADRFHNQDGDFACPGCSSTSFRTLSKWALTGPGVKVCRGCGGYVGRIEKALVSQVVHLDTMLANDSGRGLWYFDLEIMDGEETSFVHGWMDGATKAVVQFG